jgi:hypothetical protein
LVAEQGAGIAKQRDTLDAKEVEVAAKPIISCSTYTRQSHIFSNALLPSALF